MNDLLLDQLRQLKRDARELSQFVLDDLGPFLHKTDKSTFVRLPSSEHKKGDVGVTVTCSCLMALALTERLNEFCEKHSKQKWSPDKAFTLVVEDPIWVSSGLASTNAFTTTLVLRAFGFLVEKGVLSSADARSLIHKIKLNPRKNQKRATFLTGRKNSWTLRELFAVLAANPPETLRVETYPASSTIAYWFVDAIDRSKSWRSFGHKFWEEIANWAALTFAQQVSLVTSRNDALMDPIALAMAACLCKKLKTIPEHVRTLAGGKYLSLLPSEPELEFGIELLFSCQAPSGIWPKYFPLFHYPDAGGNFCFTFEMLEAVLNEFGRGDEVRILEIKGAFEGLSKALRWCKLNRFEYRGTGKRFAGWNSGGQLKSLADGKPESWATAVVHMFLWELDDVLSRKIEQELFTVYRAKKHKLSETAIADFLDIEILVRGRSRSLKKTLLDEIVTPALSDHASICRKGLSGKVSALLFGPPGTSKTELCSAVAKRLGWPLVELDPSHFLKGGVEQISVYADKIFSDLMDLTAAVVLFDEMDALVQTRDSEDWHLDTVSQLLTTSMLPKLTKLHENRRVIFFMATNFQNRFDPAIKRAGRFDLLLCMGPPTLESKVSALQKFVSAAISEKDLGKARGLLQKHTEKDPELAEMFNLFTFGEAKAFFRQMTRGKSLVDGLKNKANLKKLVEAESEFNTLRVKDLEQLPKDLWGKSVKQLERDNRMNFELPKDVLKFPIVRYIADKRLSKIQA
jgi:hypothetical protein